MQDRYAGDIGDFVKLALLRKLSPGYRLGVAWYLYPDEQTGSVAGSGDGKHVTYLDEPEAWSNLDADLFDKLGSLFENGRSVSSIESHEILDAKFSSERIEHGQLPWRERSDAREAWFQRVLSTLSASDLVFADPDNGLIGNEPCRRKRKRFGKQIPLDEARRLANGRTAVIYHHNSRFKGGHALEVDYWNRELGPDTIAIRANAYSCRTFFIVNPTPLIAERAKKFCDEWKKSKVFCHVAIDRHRSVAEPEHPGTPGALRLQPST